MDNNITQTPNQNQSTENLSIPKNTSPTLDKPTKKSLTFPIIIFVIILVTLISIGYIFLNNKKVKKASNYDECMGLEQSVKLEITPGVCIAPDGTEFQQ